MCGICGFYSKRDESLNNLIEMAETMKHRGPDDHGEELYNLSSGYVVGFALQEIEEKYGLRTTAIVTMEEVVEHLYNRPHQGKVIIDDAMKTAIDAYYEKYGASSPKGA